MVKITSFRLLTKANQNPLYRGGYRYEKTSFEKLRESVISTFKVKIDD